MLSTITVLVRVLAVVTQVHDDNLASIITLRKKTYEKSAFSFGVHWGSYFIFDVGFMVLCKLSFFNRTCIRCIYLKYKLLYYVFRL